jgi:ribosomal silencing factor RsfS
VKAIPFTIRDREVVEGEWCLGGAGDVVVVVVRRPSRTFVEIAVR